MATLNSLDYRLHVFIFIYFFDGCILRFLKVLFSFVLFYSPTLLAAIVSHELHAFKSNRWLNCPFSTRHVLKHLWLWLVCWWCFTRFSCLVATVAQSQKDQTDLELIKRSITRLWISFNFLIIRLIVWAKISFSCPPTPPSSSTLSSPAPPSRPRPQTPSALIYFVSPFTLQKTTFISRVAFLNKLNLPVPFSTATPSHICPPINQIQHVPGYVCGHTAPL